MAPLYSIGSDAAGCRRSVFCAVIGVIAPMCKVRIPHRGVQDWGEIWASLGCQEAEVLGVWCCEEGRIWASRKDCGSI